MLFLKEGYNSAETTKVLHVSLLKVICVDPKSAAVCLEPPYDLARWKKGDRFADFTEEYVFKIYTGPKVGQPTVFYHTDYLVTDYEYSDDYGHEISEDLKKAAAKDECILVQTVWDICIFECSWEPAGTSAEELANSISWELNVSGDVFTKILSAKFSSSFFTKCAILSDVVTNHSDDDSFTELIEYNDIGLPLAQRVNLAEEMSDLDEEDIDNLDYIDETWEQLCETLGVDKDGDYTSLAQMRAV